MLTGRVLGNRYRIGERIGGGGMALVYRAEDRQLGRDVAVKVLRGQYGTDEEFIRRFRREAQNAASLSHPNVVQIYDVGREDDLYYIVMELVEGQTLKAMIQEQGPLPVLEAARIATEILSALSHAHNHKIVHRDIKPHNILLARDGRAKVTDFGIARATTTDTVTHTGSIIGSAHYFSPEQANGQPTGDKSDIYSVGVVLYEMVTGVVPFQGESPITVALKHIREKPVPPSQLNSEVPVELEKLIMRALEKDPADRYPSARDMMEALQRFMEDHSAGRTHMHSGDFPTMDLRAMKHLKGRRLLEEEEEPLEEESPHLLRGAGGKPRRRSLAWLWVTLVSLLVVGGIGGALYALVGFLEVPEVVVPRIEGKNILQAQDELARVKLRYIVQSYQHSDELPENSVIKAMPGPGTPVKQGREIALVLSRGPEAKQLPDVRGKTEEDARARLETERLRVEIARKHSPEPEGRVIDQQPPPLTQLKVGSTVQLTVSLGPLRVPQIYGLLQADAEKALSATGLVVGKVDTLPDPTKPKGTVLSSDPREGAPVVPGQAVNLVVAQGALTGGKAFSKELTVPGQAGRFYEFKVVLVDVVAGVPNEQVVESKKRQAGEKVTVSGTFFGEAYLKVLVDNTEVQRVSLP